MFTFSRTKSVLKELEAFLKCSSCGELLQKPCCLGVCDHIFCQPCVTDYAGNQCPVCSIPCHVKDLQPDRQLDDLLTRFRQMTAIVGLNPPGRSDMPDVWTEHAAISGMLEIQPAAVSEGCKGNATVKLLSCCNKGGVVDELNGRQNGMRAGCSPSENVRLDRSHCRSPEIFTQTSSGVIEGAHGTASSSSKMREHVDPDHTKLPVESGGTGTLDKTTASTYSGSMLQHVAQVPALDLPLLHDGVIPQLTQHGSCNEDIVPASYEATRATGCNSDFVEAQEAIDCPADLHKLHLSHLHHTTVPSRPPSPSSVHCGYGAACVSEMPDKVAPCVDSSTVAAGSALPDVYLNCISDPTVRSVLAENALDISADVMESCNAIDDDATEVVSASQVAPMGLPLGKLSPPRDAAKCSSKGKLPACSAVGQDGVATPQLKKSPFSPRAIPRSRPRRACLQEHSVLDASRLSTNTTTPSETTPQLPLRTQVSSSPATYQQRFAYPAPVNVTSSVPSAGASPLALAHTDSLQQLHIATCDSVELAMCLSPLVTDVEQVHVMTDLLGPDQSCLLSSKKRLDEPRNADHNTISSGVQHSITSLTAHNITVINDSCLCFPDARNLVSSFCKATECQDAHSDHVVAISAKNSHLDATCDDERTHIASFSTALAVEDAVACHGASHDKERVPSRGIHDLEAGAAVPPSLRALGNVDDEYAYVANERRDKEYAPSKLAVPDDKLHEAPNTEQQHTPLIPRGSSLINKTVGDEDPLDPSPGALVQDLSKSKIASNPAGPHARSEPLVTRDTINDLPRCQNLSQHSQGTGSTRLTGDTSTTSSCKQNGERNKENDIASALLPSNNECSILREAVTPDPLSVFDFVSSQSQEPGQTMRAAIKPARRTVCRAHKRSVCNAVPLRNAVSAASMSKSIISSAAVISVGPRHGEKISTRQQRCEELNLAAAPNAPVDRKLPEATTISDACALNSNGQMAWEQTAAARFGDIPVGQKLCPESAIAGRVMEPKHPKKSVRFFTPDQQSPPHAAASHRPTSNILAKRSSGKANGLSGPATKLRKVSSLGSLSAGSPGQRVRQARGSGKPHQAVTDKASKNDQMKTLKQATPQSFAVKTDSKHLHLKNINKRNAKGETALHTASIKGDVNTVGKLLRQGADANTRDNAGWTPLHEAAIHGHAEIVQLLLDGGANVNAPGADNDTPLHDAVASGHVACARLLVERGALLSQHNARGVAAADLAASDEMKEALECTRVKDIESSDSGMSIVLQTRRRSQQATFNTQAKAPARFVLLSTSMNREQKAVVTKCALLLRGSCAEELSIEVTHVVTGTNAAGLCPRTMKFLLAILSGKWIVCFDWAKACIEQGRHIDEKPFEVTGCSASTHPDSPARARVNTELQHPKLFDGCCFYFTGGFVYPTPCKEELTAVVTAGGGQVLQREPRRTSAAEAAAGDVTSAYDKACQVPFHAAPGTRPYNCSRFFVHDPRSATHGCTAGSDDSSASGMTTPPGWCLVTAGWLLDCVANFKLLDF